MKIFCIGYNKTGTTSLSEFMRVNNISVAPQLPFEYNLESYFYKNYSTFVQMIKEDYFDYTFFQDVPFSLPEFYKIMDKEFENSKFILTIRDDEDVWYNSLIKFYKKNFPDFYSPKKIAGYVYEGWIFKILTSVYGAPKTNPYDEKSLKRSYSKHIDDVKKYFVGKDNLLILNLKDKDVITKLENFLEVEFEHKNMPKLNSTE